GASLMIMIGLVGHPRMVAEPGWAAPETSRLRAITELPEPRLQSFHLVTERGGASGGQARGTADRCPRGGSRGPGRRASFRGARCRAAPWSLRGGRLRSRRRACRGSGAAVAPGCSLSVSFKEELL